jgi:hypothetical protein
MSSYYDDPELICRDQNCWALMGRQVDTPASGEAAAHPA